MTPSTRDIERTKNAKLGADEWKYALKRTLTQFTREGGLDLAALLTYFTVLAIAPTLLALFSVSALLLSGFQEEIAKLIKEAIESSGVASGHVKLGDAVDSTLNSLMGSASGGTIALAIGVVSALWSASAFVKAFSRASNRIYEVKESRGVVAFNLSMLVVTATLILGLLIILLSFLLSEPIVHGLFGPIFQQVGLGDVLAFLTDSFLPVWAWVRWPVVLMLIFAVISLLFWGTPNLKRPYRFITAGGIFAVIGIAFAVVLLSIYMTTVAKYSSYGAIGGLMAVLFVLWVINIMLILGATFDAEVLRARQLAAGEPAEKSFELPHRGEDGPTKADKTYATIVEKGRELRVQNLHKSSHRYTAAFAGADALRKGTDGSIYDSSKEAKTETEAREDLEQAAANEAVQDGYQDSEHP